jgi:hypothetical protein
MKTDAAVLAEPFAVPDVYVSGLWSIEPLEGGNARFLFYTVRHGEPELAASLVAPIASIPPAIMMGFKTLGVACAMTCGVLRAN